MASLDTTGRMPLRLREEVHKSRQADDLPWALRPSVATWLVRPRPCRDLSGLSSHAHVGVSSKSRNPQSRTVSIDSVEWERGVSKGKPCPWSREVSTEAPGSDIDELDDIEIETFDPLGLDILLERAGVTPLSRNPSSQFLGGALGRESPGASVGSRCVSPQVFGDMSPTTQARLSSLERCLSPASSIDSSSAWLNPEETIIFVDYDDTLFPTSWLEETGYQASIHKSFFESTVDDIDDRYKEAFKRLESSAIAMLRAASAVAHVVIVTLAKEHWVEMSLKNYMPRLAELLAELDVDVRYARQAITFQKLRGVVEEGLDPWMIMKREAMRQALKQFYSKRPGQSWKNCVSVGDSQIEREALDELTFTRKQFNISGQQKPVRCKTVKFLTSPELSQLTVQLDIMTSCLPALVSYDGDMSHDLTHLDDDGVVEMWQRCRLSSRDG